MSSLSFGPLYNLRENSFWPTLQPHQHIPPTLASTKARSGRPSNVGMGMVKAVCTVLTDCKVLGLAYEPQLQHWTLTTASWSSPGASHTLGGDATTWWTDHHSYLTGIVALVDALTISRQSPASQEFVARWAMFLSVLQQELGSPAPYDANRLLRAAQSTACTENLMSVTDALYFFAQERTGPPGILNVTLEMPDPMPLAAVAGAVEHWLYGQHASASAQPVTSTPAPSASQPLVDTRPVATLRRLVRRGGTALLVGPTGVGKSMCARQVAVLEGATLVLVEGWPGLEDRDLFGKVYPVDGSGGRTFAWVDGPLAEAWRLASAGTRVVLVLDEFARFDPYHLAPLMGALDLVPGNQLLHVAGIPAEMRATLRPAEHYRVLKMPNGERLAAPARILSVVATTNLGADYIQTQQEFDAALLRRFDLHIDVQRLEATARTNILVGHGIPPRVAEVLVAIEDYSVAETGAHNGLLRRELNLGTCATWAIEARELVAEGVSWAQAVMSAAEVTAIPFACPRDSDGYLEAPSAQSLRDQIRRIVGAVRLQAAA
ncbi:MAG TPA: MoxR family ATPase [Ktedonobacterales bacterium]|nr:MoxR family ATPase [Ktedonobacterales bacterium]